MLYTEFNNDYLLDSSILSKEDVEVLFLVLYWLDFKICSNSNRRIEISKKSEYKDELISIHIKFILVETLTRD